MSQQHMSVNPLYRKEINFSKYKNESYAIRLKKMAASAPLKNPHYVFFGGTGAVGGQTAIEIIQAYESFSAVSQAWKESKPVFLITGINKTEIDAFRQRLDKLFPKASKKSFIERKSTLKGLTLSLINRSGISIYFFILNADPGEINLGKNKQWFEMVIQKKKKQDSLPALIVPPFEKFLRAYIRDAGLGQNFKFQAVISGIPIPSVAAYRFNKEIEKLFPEPDQKKTAVSKKLERLINLKILEGFAVDFGKIKKSLSYEVLIAHTTSVGGMFTMIKDKPVINLGYAHSAQDDQLIEKQFYANELTRFYSKLGIKTLITAAAIGIDNVYKNFTLPLNKSIYNSFRQAEKIGMLPFPAKYLKNSTTYVFTPILITVDHLLRQEPAVTPAMRLSFGSSPSKSQKKLTIPHGLRSGENGIFSVDNALSLYLNMKIATQDELAHILAFNCLFGDDKQKPWFDNNKICYQTETENSLLAVMLLFNHPAFKSDQLSGFTPKALQDLGSAKHQCELHTIGLYILLHKIKQLRFPNAIELFTSYHRTSIEDFIDETTSPLTLEAAVKLNPHKAAAEFGALLSITSYRELANFLLYQGDPEEKQACTFFSKLLLAIHQTVNRITSLGSPIIFSHNGKVKILVGPYCAATDTVISHSNSLREFIEKNARKTRVNKRIYFEWMVANNGFIDLRAQATITVAKSPSSLNKGMVSIAHTYKKFKEKIISIQEQNIKDFSVPGYFTSSGTIAFIGRLKGLNEQLQRFDISLGTRNNWRALFPESKNGRHLLIPGIVEAMRMYMEGLGKITGFELLYPGFGYFEK